MANLFETIPVYIALADLRDTTSNEDLKTDSGVSDWDASILISKAQDIIDNVIWDYWEPADETQDTIFPLLDETTVPVNIQKATVLLVENLYISWVLDWDAYELWGSRSVKSETSRWHTVSYYWGSNSSMDSNEFLNEEIMIYLKPYYLNLSAQWYK